MKFNLTERTILFIIIGFFALMVIFSCAPVNEPKRVINESVRNF